MSDKYGLSKINWDGASHALNSAGAMVDQDRKRKMKSYANAIMQGQQIDLQAENYDAPTHLGAMAIVRDRKRKDIEFKKTEMQAVQEKLKTKRQLDELAGKEIVAAYKSKNPQAVAQAWAKFHTDTLMNRRTAEAFQDQDGTFKLNISEQDGKQRVGDIPDEQEAMEALQSYLGDDWSKNTIQGFLAAREYNAKMARDGFKTLYRKDTGDPAGVVYPGWYDSADGMKFVRNRMVSNNGELIPPEDARFFTDQSPQDQANLGLTRARTANQERLAQGGGGMTPYQDANLRQKALQMALDDVARKEEFNLGAFDGVDKSAIIQRLASGYFHQITGGTPQGGRMQMQNPQGLQQVSPQQARLPQASPPPAVSNSPGHQTNPPPAASNNPDPQTMTRLRQIQDTISRGQPVSNMNEAEEQRRAYARQRNAGRPGSTGELPAPDLTPAIDWLKNKIKEGQQNRYKAPYMQQTAPLFGK